MANTGVCCSRQDEPKALMKMGLSMVLLGHVNFLLGALVHGAVLRHISLHKASSPTYAVSNVMALTAGLVGVVVGILAVILSKNTKSRMMMWSLFTVSLAAGLLAAASAVGLTVSVVTTVLQGGRSLLTHCRFPDAIGYSSITNECPFDPTRIYSTTLILWFPLIATCVVQLVFASRCLAVCISFLGLACCPRETRPQAGPGASKKILVEPIEASPLPHTMPRQHRIRPPLPHFQSERQPLRPQQPRPGPREARAEARAPEQHELLDRASLQRSSFWV
ncbi:transmembrane protein 54b [Osmerus mordax]|uniref:transmembrane protein 54b n=1 Tax=Osmerus mordax TaxID=8014 RepID=UPI0035100F3D